LRKPRRLILCGTTLLLYFLVLGCQPATELSDSPRVVASIPPLAMLAAEIRGDAAAVSSFLPPGGNPHQFEPRPSDVRRAAQASVVVYVGEGFDDWVSKIVNEVGENSKSVIRCADHVTLLPHLGEEVTGEEPTREEHRADPAHEMDPHFWLDPIEAAQIGVELAEALAEQDPVHATDYRDRARALALQLERLDAELRDQLEPLRGTRFIATHAGWAYFARRYGLEQVAVVELAPGREPGPRRLAQLVELAHRKNVKAIFSELQLADGSARVLSSELNVPVIALDPLGGAGVVGRDSVEALLRWNAQRLVDALAPVESTRRE